MDIIWNSNSESPQNEDDQAKELSSTDFWSFVDTFPCSYNIEDNEYDNETTEFSLTGKSERNLMTIEAEVRRLTDKIRDQQDLFDKRECTYKEEVTRLKTQLEEGNKIRK